MNLEDFDKIVRLFGELGGGFRDLGEMVFELVHQFLSKKYQGKTMFIDENDADSFIKVSGPIGRYPGLELREVKDEVELRFAAEDEFRESMASLGDGTGKYKDGKEMPKPGPLKIAPGFYMIKEPTSTDPSDLGSLGCLVPLKADLTTAKKITELEALLSPIEAEWIAVYQARKQGRSVKK